MYINFIWEPAKPMYLGEERAPGECWMMGRDGEEVLHTLFSEEDVLLNAAIDYLDSAS